MRSLRDIFLEHDPSGLLSAGAPEDEHDDTIHKIISRLQHVRRPVEVLEVLEAELGAWIKDAGQDPEEVCRPMAKPVWDAWRAYREKAE